MSGQQEAEDLVGGWAAHIVSEWRCWERGDLEKYIHEIRNAVLEEAATAVSRPKAMDSTLVDKVDVLLLVERLVDQHHPRLALRAAVERLGVRDPGPDSADRIRALKRPVVFWP